MRQWVKCSLHKQGLEWGSPEPMESQTPELGDRDGRTGAHWPIWWKKLQVQQETLSQDLKVEKPLKDLHRNLSLTGTHPGACTWHTVTRRQTSYTHRDRDRQTQRQIKRWNRNCTNQIKSKQQWGFKICGHAWISLQKTVTNVPKVACKNKNSPAAVVRPQNEGSKYHPKMQNKIGVRTVKGKKQTQDPLYCTGGGRKTICVSSWVCNTLKFTKKLHSGIPTFLFPPSPSAAPPPLNCPKGSHRR